MDMKKSYAVPETRVYVVECNQILASSGGSDNPNLIVGEDDDSFGTGSGTISPGSAV